MTDLNRAIERLRSAPLQTQIGEMPEEMRLVIKAAESAPQWINPKDRLPEDSRDRMIKVQFVDNSQCVIAGYWQEKNQVWRHTNHDAIEDAHTRVIGWMERPQLERLQQKTVWLVMETTGNVCYFLNEPNQNAMELIAIKAVTIVEGEGL